MPQNMDTTGACVLRILLKNKYGFIRYFSEPLRQCERTCVDFKHRVACVRACVQIGVNIYFMEGRARALLGGNGRGLTVLLGTHFCKRTQKRFRRPCLAFHSSGVHFLSPFCPDASPAPLKRSLCCADLPRSLWLTMKPGSSAARSLPTWTFYLFRIYPSCSATAIAF